MRHWFDGLAMLHRFTIDGGGVSYGSRYLQGRSYRAAQERGRDRLRRVRHRPLPLALQARAEPVPPGAALTDNANVNVTRLGERFIAMTETPMPVQFDPHTLDTAGVLPFATPGELTTAHPHLDRDGGGMLNYAAKPRRALAATASSASPADSHEAAGDRLDCPSASPPTCTPSA